MRSSQPNCDAVLAPEAGDPEMLHCSTVGAPGNGEPLGWDPAEGWGRCPGCPYSTPAFPAHGTCRQQEE